MENLRQDIELDLHDSLESEFKIPVELISPDGETQRYSVLNPDEKLGGRVQYLSRQMNPETGEPIVVSDPIVSLRIASLIRVPKPGERWVIRMPVAPRAGAEIKSWSFGVDKSQMHATDIGFLKIYPQQIDQEQVRPVSS